MTKLDERKRILSAKKYFNDFCNIREYCFVENDGDLFSWHNKIIKDFYKIDREIVSATFSIEHSVKFTLLWEKVYLFASKFPWDFFTYRNGVIAKVKINDMKSFLKELFEKQYTYDFYMLSLNPDRVMAFCDNEYDVEFLYIVK